MNKNKIIQKMGMDKPEKNPIEQTLGIEGAEEFYKMAHYSTMEIVKSRIPKSGLQDMDINDFIASLTNIARFKLNNPPYSNRGKALEPMINPHVYLRDKFNVQTYGEALQVLEEGRVPSNVIEFFLAENMLIEVDAVYKGYSEFRSELKKLKSKHRISDLFF